MKGKKLKQSASNIFNNSEVSLISNLNKANKGNILAITKDNVILENNEVKMCGCAPQSILNCKSPN